MHILVLDKIQMRSFVYTFMYIFPTLGRAKKTITRRSQGLKNDTVRTTADCVGRDLGMKVQEAQIYLSE